MGNSLLGLFRHVDVLVECADRCKKAGYGVQVISPIPLGHELEHAFGPRTNQVRYFTGFGAFCGFFFGWIVAFGTAFLYILPRNGRPILPITPTLLISYETTILFGVLGTFFGFFVLSRLPSFSPKPFHPRIAVDAFGLLVDGVREDKLDEVEKILQEYGAEEVKRVEECGC